MCRLNAEERKQVVEDHKKSQKENTRKAYGVHDKKLQVWLSKLAIGAFGLD